MRRELAERELTSEGPRRSGGPSERRRSVTVNLAESPLTWLHARGHLSEEGPFRQWTNGNLQALLEPTESGQQLRLKTAPTPADAADGVAAALCYCVMGVLRV